MTPTLLEQHEKGLAFAELCLAGRLADVLVKPDASEHDHADLKYWTDSVEWWRKGLEEQRRKP